MATITTFNGDVGDIILAVGDDYWTGLSTASGFADAVTFGVGVTATTSGARPAFDDTLAEKFELPILASSNVTDVFKAECYDAA